eukprot:Unigene5564_Nuclearia_a/m.17006 Unigene5564_Nuclearia_a/g.17006  ORF Unigene5564_Nuclearia_a/g.17006 Unigene5564_Nuclearia_a/m.17006 type:complete len:179 (+) Unigene5564_Nuclearia_a:1-537(+)
MPPMPPMPGMSAPPGAAQFYPGAPFMGMPMPPMMPGLMPMLPPTMQPGMMGGMGEEDEDGPNKRARTDEAALVPEHDFLQQHPQPEAVRVVVPLNQDKSQQQWKFNGQTEEVEVPLSTTVGQLKEALQQRVGVPAGKVNLRHPVIGLLKDQNTLAYYNIGHHSPELQLLLRERGGRKK